MKKIREQSQKGKKRIKLNDLKLRIIILTSVIGALIVILFMINAFTSTGNVINHHAILHLSNIDWHLYSFQINEIFSLIDRLNIS